MLIRHILAKSVLGFLSILFSTSGALSQVQQGPDNGETVTHIQTSDETVAPVWPANIIVSAELKPFLQLMLTRSATFRRQCERISRSPQMRISVLHTLNLPSCRCRAMSVVKKYEEGITHINVYLFVPHLLDAEIIGHEFEHALEQAEGIDLKTLSRVNDSHVELREDGSFETKRAKRAGIRVADEFDSFRSRKPKQRGENSH